MHLRLGLGASPSPAPDPLLSVTMWELGARCSGSPHLSECRPCDPGTVEQTHSEITQCSIKGWGLKVSFVLIGYKSDSLPKWLSGSFVLGIWSESMSVSMQSGELFALQGPVIANRKTAGQEWVDDEGRSPDKEHFLLVWLRQLQGHVGHVWLVAFCSFPWKSENFQLKPFGNWNIVSRIMSNSRTVLSELLSIM